MIKEDACEDDEHLSAHYGMPRRRRRPGRLRGAIWLSDDFDAPLDDFASILLDPPRSEGTT